MRVYSASTLLKQNILFRPQCILVYGSDRPVAAIGQWQPRTQALCVVLWLAWPLREPRGSIFNIVSFCFYIDLFSNKIIFKIKNK
jgi:hypothetical protein